MSLDEAQDEHDVITEIEGVPFIYNSGLTPYMEGLSIRYVNSWLRKGFQIVSSGMC